MKEPMLPTFARDGDFFRWGYDLGDGLLYRSFHVVTKSSAYAELEAASVSLFLSVPPGVAPSAHFILGVMLRDVQTQRSKA